MEEKCDELHAAEVLWKLVFFMSVNLTGNLSTYTTIFHKTVGLAQLLTINCQNPKGLIF